MSLKVTWEIPQSYSQYLLQMKEYELQKLKYEKDRKEWEERIKIRPKKTKYVFKKNLLIQMYKLQLVNCKCVSMVPMI